MQSSVPNRKSFKLMFVQNVCQYRMRPSRKIGDENFAIVSVMPAATATDCVSGPDGFSRTSVTWRFRFFVTLHCVDCTHNLVRIVTQASHIIWYAPSSMLLTWSGTYRYSCFAHSLVRTATHASHTIWYVLLCMLHTWYVPLCMLHT